MNRILVTTLVSDVFGVAGGGYSVTGKPSSRVMIPIGSTKSRTSDYPHQGLELWCSTVRANGR
jgi:hypothetical protein